MSTPRSFLFVPGDSARKMAKAEATGAHALMLDLEDAVVPESLPAARQLVRDYLMAHQERSRQQVWVRVNPIDSPHNLPDLAQIVAGAPDGVLLPKCQSGQDVVCLDHYLTALECREGVSPGSIRIMVVATETAGSIFELGSYRRASQRLYGLTWGAEDLATALGAATNKGDDAAYGFAYQMARNLCLIGAKAAGVEPIDTMMPDFRDADGLEREVRRARQDGFTAKFAIHPDQVEIINAGFRPAPAEVERAQEIVAAFREAGGQGAVQVRGKMLDRPHLTQALQILRAAAIDP